MASTEVHDLLSGPLVIWFNSCLAEPLTCYEDLVDGTLLHNVFLQIDPEPLNNEIIPSGGNPVIRSRNLDIIVKNMKQFYEEELGHIILKLPDTSNLGKEPELHLTDIKLLLLLLLGCAVQCANKEKFITNIKTLDVDIQLAIVDCIKQVTDCQDIVMTQDSMDNMNMGGAFVQIKKLMQERDMYYEKWQSVAANESLEENDSSINSQSEDRNKTQRSKPITKSDREDNHHFAVELADWKSKVRKQRQELEEKTEALLECKEELEHNRALLLKLKQENMELMHEARAAKSYRDELDAVMERADRADRLEMEVARYRGKLTDIEFYKTRIEEMREDNRVLMETREMLEEQLCSSRRKSDKVLELESEIIKYKQLLNDMSLERSADKEKYQELLDENIRLQNLTKAVANEAALAASISDSDEPPQTNNVLSEQLTNNAQTRVLKLELENRRLTTLVESLKENSFHESSSRVLELEKEKKRLSLKVDSLNENTERLTQQNADLELVCKQALEENKKLQNSLQNQKTSFEKQQQETQAQHAKFIELEKNYDTAIKEKQRIQSLLESVKRRADDLERSLEGTTQKLDELKLLEHKVNETNARCLDLDAKASMLEREKDAAQRDIHKYKEAVEEKDVALDKAANTMEVLEKKVQQLEDELKNSNLLITRLQEIERSSKELDSRAAIDRETLETLQSNLIAEKLNTQQLHAILEKLGLSDNVLLNAALDDVVERIAQLPDVINCVKKSLPENLCICGKTETELSNPDTSEGNSTVSMLEEVLETLKKEHENLQQKLATSQVTTENLLSENAKLQVCITTLQSQSSSLSAQHTALQLANSQLVAEKEELLKEKSTQQRAYSGLLDDHVLLQSLHEQLTNEYENLIKERDHLKAHLRDVKNEARDLRETSERLRSGKEELQTEREALLHSAKSLNNLRAEHSRLKDDFRNLYTLTEKQRSEYKNLQEEHKKNKVEMHRLSLKQAEMQGELTAKDERCSSLELQMNKLNQRCEMLLQMNSGLDNDRRSLMDHITLLFSQYHELLTHSLEDKEHYHLEEKMYTDKVNHLYRQKEKLEEKIMEHYRKLESCTSKKKGFGARLVRKVKNAGTELLSKNRRSWIDDTKQADGKVYESESGGNDSDASIDDHRLTIPADSKSLGPDTLSLGHPGTRRTVYYTDDSSPTPSTLMTDQMADDSLQSQETDMCASQIEQSPHSESRIEPRPFLVYNKISAVINENKHDNNGLPKESSKREGLLETSFDKGPKIGNPIWYEYGCV